MIQKFKKKPLGNTFRIRKKKNTMENFPTLAILFFCDLFWDGISDSWRRRTLGAVAEELGNPSFLWMEDGVEVGISIAQGCITEVQCKSHWAKRCTFF